MCCLLTAPPPSRTPRLHPGNRPQHGRLARRINKPRAVCGKLGACLSASPSEPPP
ncbi:hypothetical protein ACFOPN_05300 [Xanthomonas hyacinthi]|uniref:hypothetical protein n=1 Tax=Xanthomonas hyacinthi TaxID=56455 RepID=UPI00361FBA1E